MCFNLWWTTDIMWGYRKFYTYTYSTLAVFSKHIFTACSGNLDTLYHWVYFFTICHIKQLQVMGTKGCFAWWLYADFKLINLKHKVDVYVNLASLTFSFTGHPSISPVMKPHQCLNSGGEFLRLLMSARWPLLRRHSLSFCLTSLDATAPANIHS